MVLALRPRFASRVGPLFVVASLGACGGGGGGASAGKSDVVKLAFPPAHALTDDPHAQLRGTTHRPTRVANVAANGLPAATADQFANWTIDAALSAGGTTFAIEAEDANGGLLSATACTLEFAPLLRSPVCLAFDPDRGMVLIADSSTESGLLGLDLATGRPTIVSGRVRGSGPDLESVRAVATDEANDRAFVSDVFFGKEIQVVQLRDGERRILSGNGVGSGVGFGLPADLGLDAAHGRLLVADLSLDAVLAVDLANGARSVLSDATHGAGPVFDRPVQLAVDVAGNRVIVLVNNASELFSVDLATGERRLVSGATRGTGPALFFANDLAFEPATGAVLAANGAELLRVDLATGDRTLVADDAHGAGPSIRGMRSIALLPDGRFAVFVESRRAFVVLDPATGDRTELEQLRIGDGPGITRTTSLTADPALRDLLLLQFDGEGVSLWSVDPATGDRVLVSSPTRGGGSVIFNPTEIAVDLPLHRVLVPDLTARALIAVDLGTGDRSVLSDAATGTGIPLDTPVSVVVDAASGRAYVADIGDFSHGTLIGVDLETGDRVEFSGANRGSGPDFRNPSALALEAGGRSLLVLDPAIAALLRIDLVTGDRTVVSGPGVGAGPEFDSLQGGFAIAADGTHLYASDRNLGILDVDVATGDRTIVVPADPTLGPAVGAICRFGSADETQLFGIHPSESALVQIDLASGRRVVMSR